jgi:hypothetical protein
MARPGTQFTTTVFHTQPISNQLRIHYKEMRTPVDSPHFGPTCHGQDLKCITQISSQTYYPDLYIAHSLYCNLLIYQHTHTVESYNFHS